MDLSMEAVLAGRGVLMTLEGDQLERAGSARRRASRFPTRFATA